MKIEINMNLKFSPQKIASSQSFRARLWRYARALTTNDGFAPVNKNVLP